MRVAVLAGVLLAAGAVKAQETQEGVFHLEMVVGGDYHFATFDAETPTGGVDRIATRFWTGGFDLCPAAVVTPWVDLGGCLGLHVGAGEVPSDDAQWFADTSPMIAGRVMLRAVFRAPRYLRGGLDLMYRSFMANGRESALEVGLRAGVELPVNPDLPLFIELVFRAPLVTTRSDSTYAWPRYDEGILVGFDALPTDDVRIYTLGLQLGTYWSL